MLIDTHVLLWAASRPEVLRQSVLAELDRADKIFVSTGSLFEIAIKERINKLTGYAAARDWITQQDVTILPITDQHLRVYLTLRNTNNKDPYDLLLVAVATSERLTLVTADSKIVDMRLPGLKLIDARRCLEVLCNG